LTGARRAGTAVGVPLGFAVAVGVLLASGRGPLAPPPVADLDPGAIGAWVADRGTVVAAVALVRLAALAAASWMLAASTVRAAGELAGSARLVLAAERAMPPAARRVLTGIAGAGVVGTVLAGAAGPSTAGHAAPAPSVARMVRSGAEPQPVDGSAGSEATATMRLEPRPETAGPPPAAVVDEWVVAPGDSFWSIAAEVVAERAGGAAGEREVAAYWRRLVAANADRVTTGDPDLIHPGQRFVLPA
jgi:nucleoid-associated protein YgaU